MSIRLKTLVWVLFISVLLVVIPLGLLRAGHHAMRWQGTIPQWGGAWLLVNGLGLMAWCANLFNVQGRGTPLPFDPPAQCVVSGPYRYVRNPMMLGALLVLGGEAVIAGSWALWGYVLVMAVLVHLVVRFVEEPELSRRFGESYREYQRQVPRWIPLDFSRAKR